MSESDPPHEEHVRWLFRRHLWAYFGVNGALLAVNIATGGGWWSFWPMFAWGVPLSIHFFYFKSVTVEDDWVQERADDLKLRSYDLGHIEDIRTRVEERDSTMRPADECKDV